jgi:NADP-dependent aldehyde dehydrogenase
MELTGKQLIAGEPTASNDTTFSAQNPNDSTTLEPAFHEATGEEIDRAMRAAAAAFDAFRARSAEDRAALLDAIADEVEALGDALLERAHAETGLPMPRLTGERGRATGQARLFANLLREGSWVDARIDLPQPDRKPLPKPDVRRLLAPIGPVVMFGASNFPLAISVIGTDTVSALGAGCPVVVKGHPGHPGTCEMLARAVATALEKLNFPKGAFSLVQGTSNDVGMALVKHPATQAVAFTGSLRGGRALADAAAARPTPIPVYAEMGSVNPVFVLPGAAAERGDAIAQGYVQSVTLGAGQFCTNPGLLLGLKSDALDAIKAATAKAAGDAAPATMLHAGISKSFENGLERVSGVDGVSALGCSSTDADTTATQAACSIFSTNVDTLLGNPDLFEENFGPSSVVVESDTAKKLEAVAEKLEGQLTATIHGTAEDLKNHAGLVRILERKVGRLIFNGFPTGIEVCPSMHHGGPYPAATHSHFTSIGTASILRFVRPVCYQGFPDAALPVELQNGNPKGVWRLVDGELSQDAIGS